MKRSLPYIFLSLFVLALATALPAAAAEELIAQGDALYAQRADPLLADQCLARYREALRLAPDNYEALWKQAKIMYFIGDNSGDSGFRLKIFKQAMDVCKKAVALRPGSVEGHYWLGVHMGMYGDTRGVLKSLFLKNDIINEMKRAIEIDGAYENGGAYCVLGRVYYKVPGLFGGSNKKSRLNLEKCVQIAPKNSTGLLFLAETYWDMDEDELAVQTLERLLDMEPDPQLVPETEKDKAEGRKLLAKYKK
jgi:tetratricopeptide (TPR) repeat protein